MYRLLKLSLFQPIIKVSNRKGFLWGFSSRVDSVREKGVQEKNVWVLGFQKIHFFVQISYFHNKEIDSLPYMQAHRQTTLKSPSCVIVNFCCCFFTLYYIDLKWFSPYPIMQNFKTVFAAQTKENDINLIIRKFAFWP